MSKYDPSSIQFLQQLLDDGETSGPAIRDLPPEQRREYQRKATAAHRRRKREAAAAGAPQPTADTVRDALADAAIMLLAVDGSGSAEIKAYLGQVFVGRAGAPLSIAARAKSGKLKPKLLLS